MTTNPKTHATPTKLVDYVFEICESEIDVSLTTLFQGYFKVK